MGLGCAGVLLLFCTWQCCQGPPTNSEGGELCEMEGGRGAV